MPKRVRRPWHAARRGASHGGLRDSRQCAADRLGGLTACLGFRMHVRAGGRVQGEGSFALSIKQGTSMAAPLVAGIAALVRQYFVEGWCASLPPPCDRGRAPPCSLRASTATTASRHSSEPVFHSSERAVWFMRERAQLLSMREVPAGVEAVVAEVHPLRGAPEGGRRQQRPAHSRQPSVDGAGESPRTVNPKP
jgi:hypothetical protein